MMDREYLRDIIHNFAVFIAIIAGLIVLVVIAFFIWVAVSAIRYPSDEDMVRAFEKNKAQLETLLDVYTEEELAQLGIAVAESGYGPSSDAIWFTVTQSGLVGTSDWKGYLHSHDPPSPLVVDTDDYLHGESYRQIAGDWYIFHGQY